MQILEIKYKHILYATEFSDHWQDVFCHALGIAKHYNGKLTLLYVVNTELIDLLTFDVGLERSPSIDKKFSEAKEFTTNIHKQIIKKISEEFEEDILKYMNVMVERGTPSKIIMNVAEALECDLIVMGFKGKTAQEDSTIGSTVNKVLHKSKLPVLVIHNI